VTLYEGKPITSFTDKKVQNGNRYAYVVQALDDAGNAADGTGAGNPVAPLLSPRQAAHLGTGATLRWRPVPRAAYYNVQLWLRGRKVLSTWPAGPSLRLPRLRAGTYTWLVWPGVGPRARHRYGPLIGRSSFVVKG
jgi:hypothetical protein